MGLIKDITSFPRQWRALRRDMHNIMRAVDDLEDGFDLLMSRKLGIPSYEIGVAAKDPNFMPKYSNEFAVGADAKAYLVIEELDGSETPIDEIVLEPGAKTLISLGIFMEIPEHLEAQIRARSGLASKLQVILLTGTSTIDPDYRGEVKVALKNLSDEPFTIKYGDRICQLVIQNRIKGQFTPKSREEFSETERGVNGFGHTGMQ
jgi:dUTP pyrophosphatase